jgi:orotate phosphoribosyltransferase
VTPQPDRVLDLFERTGAYLQGHFRLSSGLHSSGYLQSALVLQHPKHAELLGKKLAEALSVWTTQTPIGSVISPALGGLIIGHEVARALVNAAPGVRFLFTERDADRKMSLRRGFSIAPGEKVIVIEDVITTGGSTREVIEVVRALGGIAVAGGSIIDRSGGAADLGIPLVALEILSVPVWEPERCPLCLKGEPVTKPGSRPA